MPAYARGCALLGGGGGGDTAIGRLVCEHILRETGPVRVLRSAELDPDAIVMPCGMIGSPVVPHERIWSGDEGRDLIAGVEAASGRRVAAIMPYEIAGQQGLLPVAWAAATGLPLVDADGMGRAFPEMQQQTMHLAGVSASPLVLTDGRGNTTTIRAIDNLWAEHLARAGASAFGGVCAGALYVMPAAEVARAAIVGSISRALAIGVALRRRMNDPVEQVARAVGGEVLVRGKLVELQREVGRGFVAGWATVVGVGPDRGRALRLELQNELHVVLEDGAVLAAVPDIICVLELESAEPLVNERLSEGSDVAVVTHPAPRVWRTPAGLATVGPAAFGYELPEMPQ